MAWVKTFTIINKNQYKESLIYIVQEMRMTIGKNDTEDRHQNLGFLSGTENIFENGLVSKSGLFF